MKMNQNKNVNEQKQKVENKQLTVTSLDELREYAKGTIIKLPDFASGQPFVARLKRPSMLALVKEGKIPNELLTSANEIFKNGTGKFDVQDKDSMKQMFDILEKICEASLIEPTYQQIKDAGITLSDDQLMAIFAYTQQGVKALKSFR